MFWVPPVNLANCCQYSSKIHKTFQRGEFLLIFSLTNVFLEQPFPHLFLLTNVLAESDYEGGRLLGMGLVSQVQDGRKKQKDKNRKSQRQSSTLLRHHLEGPREAADAANGSLKNYLRIVTTIIITMTVIHSIRITMTTCEFAIAPHEEMLVQQLSLERSCFLKSSRF